MALVALDHPLPGNLRSFAVLVERELAARLASFWMYLLATAACVIAVIYGAAFQSTFETETVLVSSNPLAMLNAVIAVFLALVLGLRLAASLSWEREHQTLEVLLVAPVGARAVLLSKFASELVVLMLIIAIYAVFLSLGQPLGDGVVRWRDIGFLVAIVPCMLPVVALGLLVSSFFSHVRAAVLAYLIAVGALVAYETVLAVLEGAQPQGLSLVQIYLRAGMIGAEQILGRLSAVAPLADLIEAAIHQTVLGWFNLSWSATLTVVTLGLAAETFRVRGGR
jgi:ABC-type transport system involved in multi-copper enzyme maturation permease subunit